MNRQIGVIGLGQMGAAMASTLAAKGWCVSGWDQAAAVRERSPVALANDLSSLIRSHELLVLSLPDSAAVEAVTLTEVGVLGQATAGSVIIDCSTAHPTSTRRIQATLAEQQIGFVDAPVSGGPAGAASGSLTIMVGGEPIMVERATPVLADLARQIHRVGGPGAGNVAKLVNNFLVAGQLLLVGEALRLGKGAGVATETLIETLNGCSGRSAISEVNIPRWVQSGSFDSGFSTALMRKDVALARDLAASEGLEPVLLQQVDSLWAEALQALGPEADFNRIVPWVGEDRVEGA